MQKVSTGVVVIGILIMGYSAFNYATFFLNHEDGQEIISLESNEDEKEVVDVNKQGNEEEEEPEPVTSQTKVLYPKRPTVGENIGTLEIPTIDASLPIIHGTDEDELEKGVGHYKGSVLPGEPDHSVLSGHRDSVFRNLKGVQLQDTLVVTTSAGRFVYEVVDIYIVDQYDQSVITPTSKATLSLTTCYPFTFVGSAPERYIIHSVLVDYELAD